MTILYLLIPLSLILLGLAVWAFFWAVKNDQFDDLEGPAHRILFDEDENDLSPEERERRQQQRARNAAERTQDRKPSDDSDR
ncbi:cbb3-type cytochrome oxidase assembly protein CcoS [Vreelandella aquamarina]